MPIINISEIRALAEKRGLQKRFEKKIMGMGRDEEKDTVYFLAYDIDSEDFVTETELAITHNTIAIMRGVVPRKKDKARQTEVIDLRYRWEPAA